jgi:hypothetical protein
MGLILLEALLALFIFIAIVWWTMFSGRSKGELPQAPGASDQAPSEAGPPVSGNALSEAAPKTPPTTNPAPEDSR